MFDTKKTRAICDAATSADQWTADVWIETDGYEWRATGPGHEEHSHDHGSEPGCPDEQAAQRDRAFIAHARTALPEACDRIEALERVLAEAIRIGHLLVAAAERDGEMSDEEVSGYRGRGEARLDELSKLLPTLGAAAESEGK